MVREDAFGGVEEGDALHVTHGFENEGGLSGPAVTLHDDVLARLYARSEFAFKCRTRAEEVSVNCASVFEWVHCRLFFSGCCTKRYYAKRYYAVWHNAESVSYCADESNPWPLMSFRNYAITAGRNG